MKAGIANTKGVRITPTTAEARNANVASLGARGVPAALAIAYSALAVVSAIVFRQGRWKRTKI